MCLYEKEINNPSMDIKAYEKGTWNVPKDTRQWKIKVGCGVCEECLKKKQSEWKIRLTEELKHNKMKNAYMVTLTFSDKGLKQIADKYGQELLEDAEKLAIKAVEKFRERYRKNHKESCKRFLVTELGHKKTERAHLHGVIMCNADLREGHKNGGTQNRTTLRGNTKTGIMSTTCELAKLWKYGQVHIGEYCGQDTIGYIIKYITKRDKDHPGFRPKILCSPGIGKEYINKQTQTIHKYKKENTNTKYTCNTGVKVALPKYYKNKLYNKEQKAEMWSKALDDNFEWIAGEKRRKPEYYKGNAYIKEIKSKDNAIIEARKRSKSKGYESGYKYYKKTWPAYLDIK